MHQSVVDTYLGWMVVGIADEWRLIADGNAHTLLTGLINKRDRAKPRVNQAVKSYLTAAMQRVISEPTLEALNGWIDEVEAWNRAVVTKEPETALALALCEAFRDLGDYYENRLDTKLEMLILNSEYTVVQSDIRSVKRFSSFCAFCVWILSLVSKLR